MSWKFPSWCRRKMTDQSTAEGIITKQEVSWSTERRSAWCQRFVCFQPKLNAGVFMFTSSHDDEDPQPQLRIHFNKTTILLDLLLEDLLGGTVSGVLPQRELFKQGLTGSATHLHPIYASAPGQSGWGLSALWERLLQKAAGQFFSSFLHLRMEIAPWGWKGSDWPACRVLLEPSAGDRGARVTVSGVQWSNDHKATPLKKVSFLTRTHTIIRSEIYSSLNKMQFQLF